MVRSFRFLLSRRWAGFAVAVVVLAYGTWWLGGWQFDRLHQRQESNRIVRTNEQAAPVPVEQVLKAGHEAGDEDEWRRVTTTGTYDVGHTIIWRYRSGDHSRNGVDVVVPLITATGNALLVDRGWLSTDDQDHRPDVPAPPSGTVEVTGWVRADATGDSTEVARFGDGLSTRALSSRTVAKHLDHPVLGGFVNLQAESPQAAHPTALEQVELPELNNGPHFFYGLQWWFFGVLAVVGFFYLMYDERRSLARGEDPAEQRKAALDERRARRNTKNAKRQAVKAAYQAAYDKEKVGRG